MGRIAVAVGCILLIVVGGLINLHYIEALCDEITAQVESSLRSLAETGSDDGRSLQAAYDIWAGRHTYLCTFIGHDQIDQVTSAFQRAMAFLSYETWDEYLAELEQLTALLQMVRTFDRPSVRSIL